MDVDNCWSGIKKRNLKVENFLRTPALSDKLIGFPRYYETCVVESKGSLSFRNVIITEKQILFTEHVPKSITKNIDFRNILDVKLVADREALVRGNSKHPCLCQHVQILYAFDADVQTENSRRTKDKEKQNGIVITPTSSRFENSEESESSLNDFSRQSSRLDQGNQVLLSLYESKVTPAVPFHRFSPSLTFSEISEESNSTSSSLSPPSPRKSYRSREQRKRITASITFHNGESEQYHNGRSSASHSDLEISMLMNNDRRFLTPDSHLTMNGKQLRGSSLMELRLSPSPSSFSWTHSQNSNGKSTRTRRPRSLDTSQLSTFRQKMNGFLFGSSKANFDQEEGDEHEEKSERETHCQVLDFYLYVPSSVILHELYLFWNRRTLKDILDEDMEAEHKNRKSHGIQSTEKALEELSRLSTTLVKKKRSKLYFNDLLVKLGKMHQMVSSYNHLPRLCWKDWTMIISWLQLLRQSIRFNDDEEDDDIFVDRITVVTILIDMFRMLYEAVGASWLISSINYNNNNNDISWSSTTGDSEQDKSNGQPGDIHELSITLTKVSFRSLMSSLFHSKTKRKDRKPDVIKHIVTCPRTFSHGQWLYSGDAKGVKAITLVHNASIALLHEIMSILQFSSKDNKRDKFMSCLQSCPMELHLQLSMTQVVNLLWNNNILLDGSQTVMLYRHVFVAQVLISNVPSVRSLLRDNFCEEFRYLVQGESANKKVPDRYPLKKKLLSMCEQFRKEIIDK